MSEDAKTAPARIGIVTVSDRASRGEYEDLGGPAIHATFDEYLTSLWEAVPRVIPDERETIERTLVELIDAEGCDLVVTTGGTGPAPRDVTPEATETVVAAFPASPYCLDLTGAARLESDPAVIEVFRPKPK